MNQLKKHTCNRTKRNANVTDFHFFVMVFWTFDHSITSSICIAMKTIINGQDDCSSSKVLIQYLFFPRVSSSMILHHDGKRVSSIYYSYWSNTFENCITTTLFARCVWTYVERVLVYTTRETMFYITSSLYPIKKQN